MKDLTKYFIDLSKCSEEEQEHIFSLLPEPRTKYVLEIDDDCYILCYKYNAPYGYEWIVCVDSFKDGRAELIYPEFIKLFEGGEGESNGWISVKDRLPDNDDEVLLYISTDIVQGYLINGIWKGSSIVTDNMNDGYVNDRVISTQGSHFDFVTHWMPLPEPPKF